MTGGFAFVANPAEYRSSGVKTFVVKQDGTVFEKDLAPATEKVVTSMQIYEPGIFSTPPGDTREVESRATNGATKPAGSVAPSSTAGDGVAERSLGVLAKSSLIDETRWLPFAPVAVAAAGCGGSGAKSVSAGDVAVVGSDRWDGESCNHQQRGSRNDQANNDDESLKGHVAELGWAHR